MELSEYLKKYPKLSNKEILMIYKNDIKEVKEKKINILKSVFEVGDYWATSKCVGKVISTNNSRITSLCYYVSDNKIEKEVSSRNIEFMNDYKKIDGTLFNDIEKRYENLLNNINSIKLLDKFKLKECLPHYTIESFMKEFPNVLGENVFDEMEKKYQYINKTNKLKNILNLREAPIGTCGISYENKVLIYIKGIFDNKLIVDVIDFCMDEISFDSNREFSIDFVNDFNKVDIDFYALVVEIGKPLK